MARLHRTVRGAREPRHTRSAGQHPPPRLIEHPCAPGPTRAYPADVSQLRLNQLTGRWVTIVSERAQRPTDFAPRSPVVDGPPERPCPFCPG
ncbi:MAG: hypothetical protein VW708_04775, partial [Ilumatobacter sp.]